MYLTNIVSYSNLLKIVAALLTSDWKCLCQIILQLRDSCVPLTLTSNFNYSELQFVFFGQANDLISENVVQCDGQAILEHEQRSDVERVDNTRQRASPFQEDLLLAAVHVDEDVSSAFGVGALYLLREWRPILQLLPAVRLEAHVFSSIVDLINKTKNNRLELQQIRSFCPFISEQLQIQSPSLSNHGNEFLVL